MGVSAPRASRAWVRTFLALVVGLLLSAGLASFAAGSTGVGFADAGPPGPTPQTLCEPPTEPCTMSNGCPGVRTCNPLHGTYGACICGGGGNIACTACGTAGYAACSTSCSLGACVVPAQNCNPNGCGQGGTQQCNASTNTWGACTGCGGAISCATTCGGNPGSGTCSPTTCGFSGTCTPPPETCNGKDDDCNGLVDDGITCGACDSL